MKTSVAVSLLAATLVGSRAQDPERTPAEPTAAPALADLGWLAGVWQRESSADVLEETWGAPIGDAIVGMFRWSKKGHTFLYELMSIELDDGAPTFRLRHFERGLKPWKSEADGPLAFPLARTGENEVVFENPERDQPRRVIYRRDGDSLTIRLESAEGEPVEFRLHKRTAQ